MDFPLSDEAMAILLVVFRNLTHQKLAQFTLEALVADLVVKGDGFNEVWRDSPVLSPDSALVHLNSRFDGFATAAVTVPPFVTCFGPSVYEGADGTSFGSWKTPTMPTLAESKILRESRNRHFKVS
jgi:hypothetical protein